jgi:hypothetical protein
MGKRGGAERERRTRGRAIVLKHGEGYSRVGFKVIDVMVILMVLLLLAKCAC